MKLLVYISILFFASGLHAQDYPVRFGELMADGDTVAQRELLNEWWQHDSTDAEYYVACFNFYIQKSMHDIAYISESELRDFNYSKRYTDSAFMIVRKGLALHPDRLDMRFGEIYMYGETVNFEMYTKRLLETVAYSVENNNNWLWTNGEVLENPRELFLKSIQDYQMTIFNSDNDSLRDYALQIADGVLKYYPDHVPSLSNAAVVHIYRKEYDKALEYLLKANALSPEDHVIIMNLAWLYRILGDYENSILYYEMSLEYGDEKANEVAVQAINEMREATNKE
ncbi:MAG: hypothetical protein C0592_09970 [Marinilabiliales bacterium]|nr:MAG: hypothetical protein C0592_09970 [Marinilabiliales bacterium]